MLVLTPATQRKKVEGVAELRTLLNMVLEIAETDKAKEAEKVQDFVSDNHQNTRTALVILGINKAPPAFSNEIVKTDVSNIQPQLEENDDDAMDIYSTPTPRCRQPYNLYEFGNQFGHTPLLKHFGPS